MATQDDPTNGNPDARRDQDLMESAMTRQLSVSLGRRISLDDLNDNSHSETAVVDSPQNGEVDVVTVDHSPGDGAPLTSQKIHQFSPGTCLFFFLSVNFLVVHCWFCKINERHNSHVFLVRDDM